MDDVFVAAVDTPVQWVFNVTGMRETPEEDGGQHVVISLSGAWQWRDTPKAELRELFLAEMAKLFPAAGAAKVKRFLVVKMLDATFRVVPGSGKISPASKDPGVRLFPGRRLDRHRVAFDHGGRGAKRQHCGRSGDRAPRGPGLTSMRVLVLAPFSAPAIAELHAAGVEVVHEDWLQTGTLQDPEELGARLAGDRIVAVVIEGDFLFAETFDLAPELDSPESAGPRSTR